MFLFFDKKNHRKLGCKEEEIGSYFHLMKETEDEINKCIKWDPVNTCFCDIYSLLTVAL